MKPTINDKEEWLNIIRNNPSYCFFNTPYWYDIHAEYYKVDYQIKKTVFNNSTVLLPLFKRRIKGVVNIYNSSALGTYGNLITNFSINNWREEKALLSKLVSYLNYEYVGSPFSFLAKKGDLFTQIIDLQKFNVNRISANHKRSIKKAQNNNIEIIEANNVGEWKKYFSIYEKVTELRNSTASNSYAWPLFEAIYELPKHLRKLWLIIENNIIIGGALIFYFNKVSYWHGCNNERCKKVGGSQFLHLHVIHDSKVNGYKIYDLCPSGGHEGVEKFKAGFASEKLYFSKIEHTTQWFEFLLKGYRLIKLNNK